MNMPIEIANALGQVAHVRRRLNDDIELAEEALTVWFEKHLQELALRFPMRRLEASSGMGSLSVTISSKWPVMRHEHHDSREYYWIWGSHYNAAHCKPWKALALQWEEMLDAFAAGCELDYVNFTRSVIVYGKDYVETEAEKKTKQRALNKF